MLQRIKSEIREVGGFGMAEDAEHTAFVVEMIVGVGDFLCHGTLRMRSNELAQAS